MSWRRPRWWQRHSLRTRLILLGVGGLTIGLAAGGAVLVAVLGVTLQRSADAEATQAGEDVARLVAEDALPNPLPVAGEQLVQVVDGRNLVLAASIGADRLTPMLRDTELARVRGGERLFIDGDRIGVRGPVRVVAVPAGEATVVVAKPMADLRESLERMRAVLLVAFPLLVAALAVVTWRVVGATLRPVEALRAGAAEITAAGRPAKLPVPNSHDEIHRLATTLNDMLDRLDAARARQRAFVADAAHELRSPLANMRTQLEVSLHLAGQTDWPEVAADLLADTQRLARLVDDLLLLARSDDARVRDRAVEPVELDGLLHAVAERYPSEVVSVADALSGAGAAATPAGSGARQRGGSDGDGLGAGSAAWTEGEPEALRRVVANLVDNAVRHARSRVELAVTRDGEHQLLLTVTDDGPGIPAADRERVFDRFTRLDDARARDAGGAGLGLAIVRELVRRHGGTVRLVEADGGGLRAEVRLPATLADQGEGAHD